MDRRLLLASSLAFMAAGRAALAQGAEPGPNGDDPAFRSDHPADAGNGDDRERHYDRDRDGYHASDHDRDQAGAMPDPNLAEPSYRAPTYTRDELINRTSDFFGVGAETAGAIVEKIFKDNGRPTGYIAGQEGSIAFIGGLRYGKGLLYMKGRQPQTVYWRGPSIGFDAGGNGSRVFTLCYNLQYPDMIYRRFPGVDGSAYFIGGLGANYQRAEDITLAPIRAGLGFRLGASVGYLAYSREGHWEPF